MKFSLLAILLFSFSFSFSQVINSSIVDDPKLLQHSRNWAYREKTEYADGENIIRIENTGNNLFQLGYVAKLSTVKHALILHKFDANGTEVVTNKLDNGKREFGPLETKSVEFHDRLFLFYFRFNDKDSMDLYVSEIDKKSLALSNTQRLYNYQQDNVGIFKMNRAVKHSTFIRISQDKSKLSVVYQDTKGAVYSVVFGDQFNLLRKSISKNPVFADNDITDVYLENSGNNEFVISLPSNSFSTVPLKGILIQRMDGKEKYQEFGAGDSDGALLNCHVSSSKDGSRTFLYGDYAGEIASDGTWLGEVESQNLKIGRPSKFPYPDELKERVYKIGFGEKKHGNREILDIDYELVEFENGSFALCGNPVSMKDNRTVTYGGNNGPMGTPGGYVELFAGPIVTAFFDKNKIGKSYGMIPRHENLSLGSNGIYMPYQDKLIVFYNDYKKNLEKPILEDDVYKSGGAVTHELSLAYAVIDKTGAIQDRKLIAEGVSRMNCFNTKQYQLTGERSLYVPSVSIDKKSDAFKVAMISWE